jgi:dCTP deaminase
MIINGKALIAASPVFPMLTCKQRVSGVSHGLSEAGYDLRIKQSMTLHPFRRFRIASTVEYFDMPGDLVAVVHDKSTWARMGLSVFNTVIEPGWFGWLTLELIYHGNGILRIPAGAGIAQCLFHQIAEPSEYAGKYQGQGDAPVPAKFSATEQST